MFKASRCGQSALSKYVSLRVITEPPSTPNAPKVEDVTASSCKVTVEPPSSDGGTPLAFYHLERRANQKGNWVRAIKDKLPVEVTGLRPQSLTISDLIADNVYEFRVAAENADALTSEFSLPSTRVSTKPPFSRLWISVLFYDSAE